MGRPDPTKYKAPVQAARASQPPPTENTSKLNSTLIGRGGRENDASPALGCGYSKVEPRLPGGCRLLCTEVLDAHAALSSPIRAGDFGQVSLYLLSELARDPLDLSLKSRESKRRAV